MDDFVRNFLLRNGMQRTLDCFQTEWYELYQQGKVVDEDPDEVPDVYVQNQKVILQARWYQGLLVCSCLIELRPLKPRPRAASKLPGIVQEHTM